MILSATAKAIALPEPWSCEMDTCARETPFSRAMASTSGVTLTTGFAPPRGSGLIRMSLASYRTPVALSRASFAAHLKI